MARDAAALRAPVTSGRGFVSARAVGSYVPKLTHKAFEKFGFAAAALITDWATIVGKDTATYTAPERLKWPRAAGLAEEFAEDEKGRPGATLIIRVDPARALDVEYRGPQILERINGHFGYRAVAELRILQAPLAERQPPASTAAPVAPHPAAAAELAGIADERLRTALARLQSGVMHGRAGR